MNGLRVQEKTLVAGDYVAVGPCRFLVLGSADDPSAIPQVSLLETQIGDPEKLRQYHDDLLAAEPDRALEGFFEGSGALPALRGLLRAAAALGASLDHSAIGQTLLDSALRLTGCTSGAVLLPEEAGAGFHSIAVRNSDLRKSAMEIPDALIRRVMTSGIAVALPSAGLAVPFATFQHVLGVLYLQPSLEGGAGERQLRLAAALGAIAGVAFQNARNFVSLARQNRRLQDAFALDHDLIGDSEAMRSTYEFIARAAGSEATVLIEGETGTGKELVARAVHRNSSRRNGPFVAVNCAAVTESLFESELFGHERGAFTGAVQSKAGLFEHAQAGTLFLDEIGEMPLALQAKLLRALQERRVRRLGALKDIPLNVRIVAATNRPLAALAQSGEFRPDLFYRLNVLALAMAPLRDRVSDILPLAHYFLKKHGVRFGVTEISESARQTLVGYNWPGNVRELENAIERACVLGDGPSLVAEDFPGYIRTLAAEDASSYRQHLAHSKRELVLRTLRECDGNQSEAARRLGLHRNYIGRVLQASSSNP